MIEFGKDLKAAREAMGLTISNIAESTHMMSAMVEDLENENFSRIVAPIYGRGYVKLYCEAVGLDPKPYVNEFMDIYNGVKDPTIRTRKIVTATEENQPAEENASAESNVTVQDPDDLFASPTAQTAYYTQGTTVEDESEPEPEPTRDTRPRFNTHPKFKQYSSLLQERIKLKFGNLDPKMIRIGILVLTAVVALWLFFLGIRGLYRLTTSSDPAPEASAPVETEVQGEATPAKGRAPIDIPPLYID